MSTWKRVSSRSPCPVCGKPDWCGITPDASAACCMRIESAKRLRNGGWLHRLRDGGGPRRGNVVRVMVPKQTDRDFGRLAECYKRAAGDAAVTRFAGELGVSFGSLRRLHVGWDGHAWTFPMTDANGTIVGIRRRFPDGRKLSVKGGREGLFIPDALSDSGPLIICEGPTDCAALLTLELPAIGRPSCHGGVQLLCKFCRGRGVVVFADGDDPGRVGARILAQALRLYCPAVRVVRPPSGVKDIRSWVQRDARVADVQVVIGKAEPLRLTVQTKPAPFVAEPVTRRHCHVR